MFYTLFQKAVDHWLALFHVNGTALVLSGEADIIEYQLAPAINERAYIVNRNCDTPAAGKFFIPAL